MPGSKDRLFLDTNILLYAYDPSAAEKHAIAKGICRDLWEKRLGLLSTQVLQEFYVAGTTKIARPINSDLAKMIIADLLCWDVVVNDGDSLLEAIDIQKKRKISFWDALIVQAAVRGRAKWILSEDFTDGQVIEGVTIINPFRNRG